MWTDGGANRHELARTRPAGSGVRGLLYQWFHGRSRTYADGSVFIVRVVVLPRQRDRRGEGVQQTKRKRVERAARVGTVRKGKTCCHGNAKFGSGRLRLGASVCILRYLFLRG